MSRRHSSTILSFGCYRYRCRCRYRDYAYDRLNLVVDLAFVLLLVTILSCSDENTAGCYRCHGLSPITQGRTTKNIQIRPVISSDDMTTIRRILVQEYMNPLSISTEHLLVAYDTVGTCSTGTTNGSTTGRSAAVVAIAAAAESSGALNGPSSIVVNPNHQNETNTTTKTLTTTTTNSNTTPLLVGFGQIRPLNDECSMELASLYVVPQYRHLGIATQLIQSLLLKTLQQQQQQLEVSKPLSRPEATTTTKKVIYLLTLRTTVPLYEPHGFRIINDRIDTTTTTTTTTKEVPVRSIPIQLQFEYIMGSFISKLLGNDLVCMIRQ